MLKATVTPVACLKVNPYEKRYIGVRSGMALGVSCQKQNLIERQLPKLLSLEEHQPHMTEGQLMELPQEELLEQVENVPEEQKEAEEPPDELTEEQYSVLLEMVVRVRLLLEETNAMYARQIKETKASISSPLNYFCAKLELKKELLELGGGLPQLKEELSQLEEELSKAV